MTIKFPVNFLILFGTTYDYVYLSTGVDDIEEDNPAVITFTSDLITIANFQEMKQPELVVLYVRAKNPVSIAGNTTPLEIRTYTDSSSFIFPFLIYSYIQKLSLLIMISKVPM